MAAFMLMVAMTGQPEVRGLRRLTAATNIYGTVNDERTWCGSQVTCLYQDDFKYGTYIISQPGTYRLMEDITFHPDLVLDDNGTQVPNPSLFPERNSTTYSTAAGFKLGYFAVIAVAADDVDLDLNGYTIAQSLEHSLRQRFFSIVELGSKPFLPGTGPPQFTQNDNALVSANNFKIRDGILGLSSHSGIHGNDNNNVKIINVHVRDFETTGVQLNGASNVYMERVEVGPALGWSTSAGPVRAMATLSQAIFLLRIAADCDDCDELLDGVPEYAALSQEVDTFIANELARGTPIYDEVTGKWEPLPVSQRTMFNDPNLGYNDGFMDGSAMYGIILSKNGPAIGELGACTDDCDATNEDFLLKKIVIHGIKLVSEEVIAAFDDVGGTFRGPDGAVLPIAKHVLNGMYRGTPLADAQIRMAALKSDAVSASEGAGSIFARFGGVYLPDALVAWAAGASTFDAVVEENDIGLRCSQDCMAHANKGVIGLRLEFIQDLELREVDIYDLVNEGARSKFMPDVCAGTSAYPNVVGLDEYKGSDVRGIVLTAADDVFSKRNNPTSIHDLFSHAGNAYGLEIRGVSSHGSFSGVSFDDIYGADEDSTFHFASRNDDQISLDRRLESSGCPFMQAQKQAN